MKEKKTTSILQRILVNCSTQFPGQNWPKRVRLSITCLYPIPPMRCSISGSRGLFYDDGNKLLLSLTSDQVFSWKVSPFDPNAEPTSDSVGEGPVLSARFSLDSKILAIQRSIHDIQFWNKEKGTSFFHRCKPESGKILGFFWTDCPTCNFVLVKTSGLDLLSYDFESQSIQVIESKRTNVSWYVYTHESRLVLLASGMQCKSFTGFQGSLPIYSSKVSVSVVDNVLLVHQVDAKVVILYDLFTDSRVPISAPLPLLLRGYPRASMSSRFSTKDDGSSELNSTNDEETTIYRDGWIFLNPDLICDTTSGLLWNIYLDLDAISASSSDVPSVLEFLQRRKLEASKAKQLCLALTKAILLEHRAVGVVAQAMDVLMTSYTRAIKTGSFFKGIRAKSLSFGAQQAHNSRVFTDEFSRGDSRGGPVKIDSSVTPSEHTVRSSTFSDSDFEEGSASSELGTGAESSGTNVQPQSELPGPSTAPFGPHNEEQQESQLISAAISPEELYRFVFSPVDEEMAGDPAYLVSVIVEFLRSATLERIRVYPSIYVLMIQLLARGDRYGELGLFVINKIIEPSKEVAYQLLESGRQHLPTRKLGIDMLRLLLLHHDYVLTLLQDGNYLEALRYARKYKVVSVQPSLFLEAAYASNDSLHLASVLRFFSDFMPAFKNTPDHATYCEILNQMNAPYIAA
ncbi:Regulator of MON1-CCZ1 complex [Bienertia sinuspersici]